MRRAFAWVAVVAACALAAGSALARSEPPTSLDQVQLTDPASGAQVPLGIGRPLLHVVLFATWCQECVRELPRLEDLAERWGERGYDLVIVAVGSRQTRERVTAFAAQRRLPGRLLFDERRELERALDAQRIPTHVLFDNDGAEVGRADSVDALVERIEQRLGAEGRGR